MNPETIKTLIVAAFAVLIFAAGWQVEGWRKDAEIDRIERAHADQRARDAVAAAEEIADATRRGNELAARAAAAESARDLALEETRDALRKVTTGRPCLSAAAVRVLNDASANPPAVPPTPGQPAGPDAAFATDTDVAFWAAYARRSYDTCRGRIDALNEFFKEEN